MLYRWPKAMMAVLLVMASGLAEGAGAADNVEPGEIRLSESQVRLIELKTAQAQPGNLATDLMVNGEVVASQDRTVQVLPRTAGVVREVLKGLGDRVRTNDALVVIESKELAEAQAAYLNARSRAALAQTQLTREEGLWKKKISAEQDYLTAKQAASETVIDLRTAERKLTLLGVDPKAVAASTPQDSPAAVRVPVTAPFEGTIIEKKVVVGDQIDSTAPLFRVADLSSIWVIVSVFEADIGRVFQGQPASISVRAYPDRQFAGTATWIGDVLDEKTRTLKVRIEVPNPGGLLKPGFFARVGLKVVAPEATLLIPPMAVQRQGNETIVFVAVGNGVFQRREVKLGARAANAVEVAEGLRAGETVVTDGSFLLKSELEKSAFADKD